MSAGLVTDEATVGRLYRIRRTVMQMLRDRGYLVVDHELATSRRDFLRKFGESFHREDLLINKYKKNDPSDQVSPGSAPDPIRIHSAAGQRPPLLCFLPLLIGSDSTDVCLWIAARSSSLRLCRAFSHASVLLSR
jgi:hypothetical protein